MRQVFSVKKTKMLPTWKQWKQLPNILSLSEQRTIFGSIGLIAVSIIVMIISYVSLHQVDIPAVGGEYTEGLIGEPQLINPLYSSTNDVDQDLVSLIYSGLMRWDTNEQTFVPDLAESLVINEDGTVYTLHIRENATFHNGEDVRARDVVFTINAIQNPSYRSPLADQFHNVRVVQEDDKTVSFILEEAYAPFTQYLTVGILPATFWAEILPQNAPLAALNLQPIGSGPYQFAEFSKDKRGSIRSYSLKRYDEYYEDSAYIEQLTFKFYADHLALFDALENKNVEGAGFIDFEQKEDVLLNKQVNLLEPLLPRQTVLYFNQDLNDALKDLVVREAIASSINKSSLVSDIYQGAAEVIHAPVLPGLLGYDASIVVEFDQDASKEALEEAGYTFDENTRVRLLKSALQTDEEEKSPLKFTLTTADQTELRLVAESIQADLERIGIEIELNLIPAELMATEVVDPRNFELLLASIAVEPDPDLYSFWHSSQTKGTGLNIANYENEELDGLLEQARKMVDTQARAQSYKDIQAALVDDAPAVWLLQPRYRYALNTKVHHEDILMLTIPSDRFGDIVHWYIKTKKALQ